MRHVVLFVAVIACVLVAGAVLAAPTTLEGKVVCAKCALHEKDRTECQNVLVVEHEGQTKQYYMAKNEASTKFGEVCLASPKVRVTGEVEQKDGHQWIVASEITALDKKGS